MKMPVLCLCLLLASLPATSLTATQQTAFHSTQPATQDLQTPQTLEADQLHQQVVQLFKEKNFNEALPKAKRVVELREKALGTEHAKTHAAWQNLAAVYSAIGNHGDAADTYERRLKAQEKSVGSNNPALIEILDKLGRELLLNNKPSAAEGVFKRQLQIQVATQGAEQPQLIPLLNNLMVAAQQDQRNAAAYEYAKRALAISEKQPDTKPLEIAEMYVRCAILLRLLYKKKEAEEHETRAREIYATLPTTPTPTLVPPNVLRGFALLKVQPDYPITAKQSRIRGTVLVRVTIDELGIVTAAEPVSGPLELHRASVEAARQWRFKPSSLNGVPLKVQGLLTFNFTLQ
jgi:TonB family protein